jgi:hypothetical protein
MTARTSLTRFGISLALACFIFALPAEADSPATRAARLTYAQGTVTVAQGLNGVSVPGELNLPLLAGVQIATGGDGQAEVEFEDGSVVRLTPNSALSLDTLTVQPDGVFVTGVSLLRGLAYCELRAAPQYQYTLVAGGDFLSPVENTTVRVNFDQPPAIFSVLDGTAHVEHPSDPNSDVPGAGFQANVRAGESFRDDASDANRYFLTPEITGDTWDQWNADLDQQAAAQASDSTAVRNDYAGSQGYGWSDLDANGNWYDVPGQGPVWQPQDAVDDSGFDPYGNGAWVWYPGAGYLWASSYAWGWTPYRCGNWSYFNGFGWGWAPGGGCGGLGWGFYGGGRPVNIAQYPTGYRPIRVPVGVDRPGRPVLPVHPLSLSQRPRTSVAIASGPRQIAGVTAQPIARVTTGAIPGSTTTGSSLRRDFPIDGTTKSPVMGLASTSPTVVRTTTGWLPSAERPPVAGSPAGVERQPQPAYGGQSYPVTGAARPAQAVRPQQPEPLSAPHYSPPPQPAQRYSPPPQTVQRYSPPPQTSRPSYAPPPSAPRSAPAPAPAASRPK